MSAIIINPDKKSRKIILSLLEDLNVPHGTLRDETDYLLSTENNKSSLLKSKEQLENKETHKFILPKT
ncbi:MAG: hypothetical protein KAX53_05055 [Saprospiraceae bacterium]|nr:hypothetical protein [Saprospiraceae bacterium]MBP8213090.1 hypothetical protein [Saprospiraceae bacterium]